MKHAYDVVYTDGSGRRLPEDHALVRLVNDPRNVEVVEKHVREKMLAWLLYGEAPTFLPVPVGEEEAPHVS